MLIPQAKEATDVEVQDQNNIDLSFFDIRGITHFEFVPEGTTDNQTFYLEVLKIHIGAVRGKRGKFWRNPSFILQHGNAPAHSLLRVSLFLAGKGVSAMDHPPYSPALAPADSWLFPELGNLLKGNHFSEVEDIKSSVGGKDNPVQDIKILF
jgi:histone-lysine N-methyltransferase SETMAR